MSNPDGTIQLVLAAPFYNLEKLRGFSVAAGWPGVMSEWSAAEVRLRVQDVVAGNDDLWQVLERCQRYAQEEPT